jgi:hypothetical protein
LFYQKKVVEEGPGYVHVSVMQSEAPPSMTQGSSLLEGEPGAVPINSSGSGPESFYNVMQ